MNARNQGTKLRRLVAQRLDRFFVAWLEQLGAGTAALWEKVELRLARSAPNSESEEDAPVMMHVPMQQQAPQHQVAQQQQQQKKPDA